MAATNELGSAVNLLTLADLGIRYAPHIAQTMPGFRQYMLPEVESRALIDLVEKRLKHANEILRDDNGLDQATLSGFQKQLAGYVSMSRNNAITD
jgi:hypothetical protein